MLSAHQFRAPPKEKEADYVIFFLMQYFGFLQVKVPFSKSYLSTEEHQGNVVKVSEVMENTLILRKNCSYLCRASFKYYMYIPVFSLFSNLCSPEILDHFTCLGLP